MSLVSSLNQSKMYLSHGFLKPPDLRWCDFEPTSSGEVNGFDGAPTVVLYVIANADASDIFVLLGPSAEGTVTEGKEARGNGRIRTRARV